jgi:hypothetical protein
MRTSPVGGKSRGTRRQRVLAAAGALVITGAVAAPPLPATQAAGGGRREPVEHAGSQVAEAGPVAADLATVTVAGALTASGSTVVAHDGPLLLAACDRLAAMDLGRVIAAGAPGDVVRHPDVVASYLGQQAPSLVGNTSPAAPPGI